MSSQRLQAQRAARPTSLVANTRPEDQEFEEEDRSRMHRNSTGLVLTSHFGQKALAHSEDEGAEGEEVAEEGEEGEEEVAEEEEGKEDEASVKRSVKTAADDLTPLEESGPKKGLISNRYITGTDKSIDSYPQHRDRLRTDQAPSPFRSNSPRSLVNGFSKAGKQEQQSLRTVNGHEKLSSLDSSTNPQYMKEKVKSQLGNNWEYFQGNTIFCWGGRLQTARDRPISVITALLIVLPVALFFGFS